MWRPGIELSKPPGCWDTVLLEGGAPGNPEAIRHMIILFIYECLREAVHTRIAAIQATIYVCNPTGAWGPSNFQGSAHVILPSLQTRCQPHSYEGSNGNPPQDTAFHEGAHPFVSVARTRALNSEAQDQSLPMRQKKPSATSPRWNTYHATWALNLS
jgi:hypothetical protein